MFALQLTYGRHTEVRPLSLRLNSDQPCAIDRLGLRFIRAANPGGDSFQSACARCSPPALVLRNPATSANKLGGYTEPNYTIVANLLLNATSGGCFEDISVKATASVRMRPCDEAMDSKNFDLDSLLTPAEFGRWIGQSESWVRRRLCTLPGVIRESRKHIRIQPRTYLEKRLKIGAGAPSCNAR